MDAQSCECAGSRVHSIVAHPAHLGQGRPCELDTVSTRSIAHLLSQAGLAYLASLRDDLGWTPDEKVRYVPGSDESYMTGLKLSRCGHCKLNENFSSVWMVGSS